MFETTLTALRTVTTSDGDGSGNPVYLNRQNLKNATSSQLNRVKGEENAGATNLSLDFDSHGKEGAKG